MFFWIHRSTTLCSTRISSFHLIRNLPRLVPSNHQSISEKSIDYAVINSSKQQSSLPPTIVFNDYNINKTNENQTKSLPKLIDIQTGLNQYLAKCNEQTLLITIESKYKLFDNNLVATFIQRLCDLNIQRDSNERIHQRLYDFVDYFILKHGAQLDFEHVLTIFYQLASLNGTANLNSYSGSYALKALIQLLKHNVNKYHLDQIGRILITLEKDLGCQIHDNERLRSLFDGLFLLTKFRQNELDRLDARALSELAYVFSSELDHIYFTNILTEYIHDEYHHDKYSTMFIFRALDRRQYKHNRILDICLHYVNENKELFSNEIDEIKRILTKLDYKIHDE